MQEKLIQVPAEKRNLIFFLDTFENNRIAIKLMRLLKDHDKFSVDRVNSRIFEISIFTDKEFNDIVFDLKTSLTGYMEVNFPYNYLFDLSKRKLGFVNSFNVFSEEGMHLEVCHKIKELRHNTVLPEQKVTI
ncbi:MAG: hypothetical protein GY834_09910 [Bacteroidetes bacterium]|nr:hypothetical protein [Bacteroidota bacterium]